MAIFSGEQQAAIDAVEVALKLVRRAEDEGRILLDSLQKLSAEQLIDGKVDGTAVFSAASAQWTGIKARIVAAVNALP